MSMAQSVERYLTSHGTRFELVDHPRSLSSMETAHAAHIPGDRLAKSVVVSDGDHTLLVVVPSTHRVDLGRLHQRYGQFFGMLTEQELAVLFEDCDPGAVPAIGPAYGMKTLLDDALLEQADIYFEAGDHEHLVHMNREEFEQLLPDADHGKFSHHRPA